MNDAFPEGRAVLDGLKAPLLRVEGLTKRYGGLVAVKDMALCVQPGQIPDPFGPIMPRVSPKFCTTLTSRSA